MHQIKKGENFHLFRNNQPNFLFTVEYHFKVLVKSYKFSCQKFEISTYANFPVILFSDQKRIPSILSNIDGALSGLFHEIMMESAPTTEAVYEGVYTLYNNRNTVEQERASKWLEQLQNSVSLYLSGKKT